MKKTADQRKLEATELLQSYGSRDYEITEEHFGQSLSHGPLKKIIVRDRFIHDASDFNKLGYGIINRQERD